MHDKVWMNLTYIRLLLQLYEIVKTLRLSSKQIVTSMPAQSKMKYT